MLKQIPIALNEPVFVIKSATRNDSIVVFTDIKDNKDHSIILPIVISTNSNNSIFLNPNWISSMYGRNSEDTFLVKQYLSGNVLYASTKKSPEWAGKFRLQLPKTLLKQSSFIGKIITQKNNTVNDSKSHISDIKYSIRVATNSLVENVKKDSK